jgi:hypothetical protein
MVEIRHSMNIHMQVGHRQIWVSQGSSSESVEACGSRTAFFALRKQLSERSLSFR